MKNKKETVKTIILIFLILTSILLSYVSNTYQPDYEIFSRKSSQKTTTGNLDNLLTVLTPSIVYKVGENDKEEQSLANTITKVADVEAIRDREVIKDILKEIATTNSLETRVRNRGIEEVLGTNSEKLSFNYTVNIDTALVKQIFFSDENSNLSLEFNTVTLLKEKPSTIYLYKKDGSNYIQVDLKSNIYDKVIEIFNKNKQSYSKYSLNNKYIYLKQYSDNNYIDEYSAEDVSLQKLGKEVFEDKENLRVSGNEVTDGYAILRELGNKMVYVNPSNEDAKATTTLSSSSYAVNFIANGYLSDTNYQMVLATERMTTFQEVFKDSLAFSEDNLTEVIIQSNASGVYQVSSAKKMPKTYLSSKKMANYQLESPDYVLNYIFKVGLKDVDDVVLGYKRTYNRTANSFSYTPTWYVKYNGKYTEFKVLQDSIDKRGAL